MSANTRPQQDASTGNLLVVQDDGSLMARTVSQAYGMTLIGAMALTLNPLPSTNLHITSLAQHEPWTLDNISEAALQKAPRDNFIFIDDGRKILSCRINTHYGVALLSSMAEYVEEAAGDVPALSQVEDAQAVENDDDQDMLAESSQYVDVNAEEEGPDVEGDSDFDGSSDVEEGFDADECTNVSSSPRTTSDAPGNTLDVLSDDILSAASDQPYDRDWMTTYHIDATCLYTTPSKHKVDMLVRYGAVKVGDKLCIVYDTGGGPCTKVGEVLHHEKSGRLDLRVARGGSIPDKIIKDCKGPRDIIKGMNRAFELKHGSKGSEAWRVVDVVSEDGEEVGSLWEVRQAYQIFEDRIKDWRRRNNS